MTKNYSVGFVFICVVILQVFQIVHTGNRYCGFSISTVRYVASCPLTKRTFDIAASKLGCESLSQKQNCTLPSNFKYHCVMNVFENETLEVCAPALYIMGYCAEFNIRGGRIQPHYQAKCTEMSPPCPVRYISTDAYKYTSCFKKVKDATDSSSQEDGNNSTILIIISTVSSIAAVFVIFFVVIVYIRRKNRELSTDENLEAKKLIDVQEDIKGNADQPSIIYNVIQRGMRNSKFQAVIKFARFKGAENDIEEISEDISTKDDQKENTGREDGDPITLDKLEEKVMKAVDNSYKGKNVEQSAELKIEEDSGDLFHILASFYPEDQKNINSRKDLCEFEKKYSCYFKLFYIANIVEYRAKSHSTAFEIEMKKLGKKLNSPTLREIYAASEMLRINILLVRRVHNIQKGILICPFIQCESTIKGYEEIEMIGSEENPLFQYKGRRELRHDSKDDELVIINEDHAFCFDRRFRNSFDVFRSNENITSCSAFLAERNNADGVNFFDVLAELMYGDCSHKQLAKTCIKEHAEDKYWQGFYETQVDLNEYENEAVSKIENENDSDRKNKRISDLQKGAFKKHVDQWRVISTGDLFAASSILNIDIYVKENETFQLIRPVCTNVSKIWNSPLILIRKSKTNFCVQLSSNLRCLCEEDMPYLEGNFTDISIAINKQLVREIDLGRENGICCVDTKGSHTHMARIWNNCRWRCLTCFRNIKITCHSTKSLRTLSEEEKGEEKIIENYLKMEGRCVDTCWSSDGTPEACLSKAVFGFENKPYANHLRSKDPEVCLQMAANKMNCPIYVFKYSLDFCRWVIFKPDENDEQGKECKFYITLLQRNKENRPRYEVITAQDVPCNCLLPPPMILTLQNEDNVETDEIAIENVRKHVHMRELKARTEEDKQEHHNLQASTSETEQHIEELAEKEQNREEPTEVRRVPYVTYISELRVIFSKTNTTMSSRMIDQIPDMSFSFCRCLSKEVYGVDNFFEIIRDSIIFEIKANKSYYMKSIERELKCILPKELKLKPTTELCCQLIRDGFELDVELEAAANHFQTPIYVISVSIKKNGFFSAWKKYKITKKSKGMKEESYITLYKNFAGRFHRVVGRKEICNCSLVPPIIDEEIFESTEDYDLDYARIQAFRMTENQLLKAKVMFQDWVRCNYILDILLENIIAKLENRRKNTDIASLAGAGIGTVGAIMSGIGIAVAPLTAGVSLGLVIAGGVISGLGGITNIGAKLTEFGLNKEDLKLAEEYDTDLRILSKQLEENLSKLDNYLSALRDATSDKTQDIPVDSVAVCLRSLSGLTSIPFLVLRVLARAVTEVDLVLIPISAAIDIYTAVKAIRSLSKGSLTTLSLKFRTARCLLKLSRKQMLVWAYGSNIKTIEEEEINTFKAIQHALQEDVHAFESPIET